jgi:hypothetical protein
MGIANTLLSTNRICDATSRECAGERAGLKRTNANDDNQMSSSGVSQSKLGLRFVLAALTNTTTALKGKTKLNPTKILPMKYPTIGGPPGIMKDASTCPNVIRVAVNVTRVPRYGTCLAAANPLCRI